MWNEKIIKIIPAVLFLFCVLQVFELVLIINNMNKTEKLEYQLQQNLEILEKITTLFDKRLEGMQLEHYKKVKIK
ncbi:hypothetical protein HpMS14_14930 [Helicobacter pylori]